MKHKHILLVSLLLTLPVVPLAAGNCTGTDTDSDGIPDACDNCPDDPNPVQVDFDGVGAGQVIASSNGAYDVFVADLDGDGDADVISGFSGLVVWSEQTGAPGSFAPPQTVSTDVPAPRSIAAADLDGDGDQDLLAADSSDDEIVWLENADGAGGFGPTQLIVPLSEAWSLDTADVDADGDVDVLSAAAGGDQIAWYRNVDGTGSFSQIVIDVIDSPRSVFAADVDGDGDVDVLGASSSQDVVVWYENLDGAGSFAPDQLVSGDADSPYSVFAVDLDGDGDADVLSASHNDDTVAWYENTDGVGDFGPRQVLSDSSDGARWVFAADVDGDGDQDVLSGAVFADEVAWYENLDGAGSFDPGTVITSDADSVLSVIAADLDGDGDADVLSAAFNNDETVWYESRNDGVGDPCDNCPREANPGQVDADADGAGAACDCADNNPTCILVCIDGDADGLSLCSGDCDDANPNCTTDCTDLDSDGFCVTTDCDESDPATYAGAPETNDGIDNQCPGDPGYGLVDETSGLSGFLTFDVHFYLWPPQAGTTLYEVARAPVPQFASPCVVVTTPGAFLLDTDVPALGDAYHYLNRALEPNAGSWGQDSNGVERTAICP